VKFILDELDRPVPQVLIKVLVAEVTHDKSMDVGAQFSVLNLRASGNGQSAGTNFGLLPTDAGAVVQILETNLTATLHALESNGKLDVLSRPYILASDNQLATITVGQRIPFITNSRVTDEGQTINTITYDDVGILLDVIPHINPDGLVIMDVVPTISALTGDTVPISDNADAPIIAKRSAQSRVAVQNGMTVVIGGLMADGKTENIDKVPLLGDIPWVGALFRRRISTKTKTELLIFLTPHVAARPEALRPMGQDELDSAKIAPGAVDRGVFQEHLKNMERGATTQPEGLESEVQDPAPIK
jgi:general secretion pathway protein D